MSRKMLIDTTHEEETRVAIVDDRRLAEFEYESKFRKPLKGSIFLAKVTRVEPSLQAAFVNFGGNRHGFLPFSEIHPDYFRIPVADQEAFVAAQEESLRAHDEEEAALDEENENENTGEAETTEAEDGEDLESQNDESDDAEENLDPEELDSEEEENETDAEEQTGDDADSEEENAESEDNDEEPKEGRRRGRRGRYGNRRGRSRGRMRMAHSSRQVEAFGGDEVANEQKFRFNLRHKYKIQEVIKRGQIMLVQASKEERGNKGAAVTSYLSLPGRYCVLMPNSPRAGGVSRKIASSKDRARMRDVLKSLDVPQGMSVIMRTAGVSRTKAEIKRDLSYLTKLWNNIRDLTLESTAPALVYEEADLIKRAVRDMYSREIEEIIVDGEDGHKTAKDFMKMMIPSHAKRVQLHDTKNGPLYQHYRIEEQIAEIGETRVELPSGGYLIINPTEALVSIDVNSGKATKERHIEETALKTNLETAEEVARQLRLRDLGGLVVIDFIDMEDRRNNAKVERKLREALSGDRARIQMGRISAFGLMELSRQRLNPSLGESQFETCPHCQGNGRIRTVDATSILVIRGIEDEALRKRAAQIMVHVPADVAIYILNNKRGLISDIEARYDLQIVLRVDDTLGARAFRVEVSKPLGHKERDNDSEQAENEERDGGRGRRGRGRRGGRNRRDRRDEGKAENADQNEAQTQPPEDSGEEDEKASKKRGRRRSAKKQDTQEVVAGEKSETPEKEDSKEEKPKRGRGRKKAEESKDKGGDQADAKAESKDEAKEEKPKRKTRAKKPSNDDTPPTEGKAEGKAAEEKAEAKPKPKKKAATKKPEPSEHETVNAAPEKKKKGWWNRLVE